jgi:microcystin-dependent protein
MDKSIKKQLEPKKFKAINLDQSKGILDDFSIRKNVATKGIETQNINFRYGGNEKGTMYADAYGIDIECTDKITITSNDEGDYINIDDTGVDLCAKSGNQINFIGDTVFFRGNEIYLVDGAWANYTTINIPDLTSNDSYTLPATQGTQYKNQFMSNDGSGNLSWARAVPVGSIIMHGGDATAWPPAGWLTCDGTAVSRTTYADLFAVIGTTFGVGDGSTTFNLPNMDLKYPCGAGTRAVGATGGSTSYTPAGTLAGTSGTGSAHTHTIGTSAVTPTTHTSQGGHTHDSHTTTSKSTSGSGTTLLTGPTTHSSQGAHTHDSHGLTWGPANESAHTHGKGSYAFTGTPATIEVPYLTLYFIIKY